LPHSMPANVKLGVSAAGRRELHVAVNGVRAFTDSIDEKRQEVHLRVTLQPGFNRFDLSSPEPAVRRSQERGHLRSFGVHEAAVTVDRGLAMGGP
jgi:hypothetical protein